MISANRSDMSVEYNEEKTKELISDLKASGFRYMPIYCGYKGDDNVVDNYEPSFMVFPYKINDGKQYPEELKEFIIDMCGKYKQNSILLVEPEGIPNYFDMNGNKINKSSTRNLSIDDALQTYFTSFKTPEENEKEFNEYFCNPAPCTLNERMCRDLSGELLPFIYKKGKLQFAY